MGLAWCPVFDELSPAQVRSLAGNSMHAASFGAVFLHLLYSTDLGPQ